MGSEAPKAVVSEAEVLLDALLRLADLWGLSQRELAALVQVSEATMSRLVRGQATLTGATIELGALVVRAYRSLDGLLSGDDSKAQLWLRAEHVAFGEPPLTRMQTIEGLVHVVNTLDALRGAG